ncbi:hypothetical protein C8Q70DRAFT_1113895 [Cubamyces menziesii]|nr:hypothetical protein C8Q70DRAFT_1113895 [Cubamyces menziesii]
MGRAEEANTTSCQSSTGCRAHDPTPLRVCHNGTSYAHRVLCAEKDIAFRGVDHAPGTMLLETQDMSHFGRSTHLFRNLATRLNLVMKLVEM